MATAAELPDALGAALLVGAREAFTRGLQRAAVISVVLSAVLAVVVAIVLRNVRTGRRAGARVGRARIDSR